MEEAQHKRIMGEDKLPAKKYCVWKALQNIRGGLCYLINNVNPYRGYSLSIKSLFIHEGRVFIKFGADM
jgi:hypothetical protein